MFLNSLNPSTSECLFPYLELGYTWLSASCSSLAGMGDHLNGGGRREKDAFVGQVGQVGCYNKNNGYYPFVSLQTSG